MAEDVSNKTLVALLVVAIFVSLGGTLLSINKLGSVNYVTGLATSGNGTAALEFETVVSVLVTDIINVTSITVNASDASVFGRINTRLEDANTSTGFKYGINGTMVSAHLNVTNDGTGTEINVTMNQSLTDAKFIGASNVSTSDALWDAVNDSGNPSGTGCDPALQSVDGDGVQEPICTALEVGTQFNVFINATIPDDVVGGLKKTTLKFVAAATP